MRILKTYLIVILFFTATVGFAQPEMILVEGGEFAMGCTDEQKPDCDGDEFPIHAVKLSSYFIGKFEVTQAQWQMVMGDNPSNNTSCGDNCPVENIDWYSMIIYCNELTLASTEYDETDLLYYKDEALTIPWSITHYNGDGDASGDAIFMDVDKAGFRLPTEAEWEFAARGGNLSQGFKFSGSNVIDDIGWYLDNSDNSIHPIGMKNPNELGLYDMTGNVWERTWNYQADYLHEHQCDPLGADEGTNRVYRGGAYYFNENSCRVADRYFNKPTRNSSNIGFRIVRSQIEL